MASKEIFFLNLTVNVLRMPHILPSEFQSIAIFVSKTMILVNVLFPSYYVCTNIENIAAGLLRL